MEPFLHGDGLDCVSSPIQETLGLNISADDNNNADGSTFQRSPVRSPQYHHAICLDELSTSPKFRHMLSQSPEERRTADDMQEHM